MFKLHLENFGEHNLLRLEDKETGTSLSILPRLGGIANALQFNIRGYAVNVIDGYKTSEEASAIKGYKSAFLIPFPNRLKDAKYSFQEEEYTVPMNRPQEQHAIHGLFYDKPYNLIREVLTQDKGMVVLSYQYDGSIEGYPFVCETQLTYELMPNALVCHVEIFNKGYEEMPLGIGWHPYFSFGHSIDKCQLHISAEEQLLVDERMIPNGKQANPYAAKSLNLENEHFDTGFKYTSTDKIVSTKLYSESFEAGLNVWQETEAYPYVQVYTPKDRQSVAIEPMSCNINALNNQEGLQVIEPGASFYGRFGVSLYLDVIQ